MGLFGPPNVERLLARGHVKGLIKALEYKKDSRSEGLDIRRAAATALVEVCDARAAVPLAIAASSLDWTLKQSAIEALEKLGRQAFEPLVRVAMDGGAQDRREATVALGLIGDERAIGPLTDLLDESDSFIRSRAAAALGNIGHPAAVDYLIGALGDMEWDVRAKAIQALEKIGNKRAAPAVIDRLGDVEEIVRHYAAIALGALGDERAVDPLIHALGDSSKYVRDKSAVALGSIGDTRAVEPLVAAVRNNSGEAANALVKIGQSAVLPLIRELDCPNREDSLWKSITVLGMIGDERAVKPLSRHLFTENDYIRGAAANALKRVGWPAKKLMVEMLSAKDWWGRCGAAQVLREIGDEHAVEPLSAMLEKPNYVTNNDHYARKMARLAAAEALEEIGDERARNGLHAAIVHGSVHVREAAARALIGQRILDSTSVQPLIEALRKHWEDHLYLQALAMVGEAAVEPLAKELPNLSPYTRVKAMKTLGEMGGVRAVDHLIGWLDTDEFEVRQAAAKALEQLGWSLENGRCS